MTRKTERGWLRPYLKAAVVMVCIGWVATPVVAQQAPPFYKVVDLGILPGGTSSSAMAVNADGTTVVGQAKVGTKLLPFLWRDGVMSTIGDPATMKSGIARDINGSLGSGKIVGEWVDSLNKKHAFVFDDNAGFRELPRYGTHTNATAWGLNELGQVVGYSWVSPGIPVRWDSDTLQPTLLYTGAPLTYGNCTWSGHSFYPTQPIKINEAGHLVSTWSMAVTNDCGWPPGYTLASSLVSAAVKNDNGTWRVSGGPPIGGCYPYYSNYKFYECADSYGVGINNNDTVVDYGQYRAYNVAGIPMFAMVSYMWFDNNTYQGFRGLFTCLADQLYVKAINDSEVIVGNLLKQDNQGTTCVDNKPYKIETVGWVRHLNSPTTYLMDRIRQDCGWTRLLPNDINNAGMIVGAGLHSDGTSHAFMLLPVDSLPATHEGGCIGHGDIPTSNQPPVANAGPDQTMEATSPAGADVILNGGGSSDPDNDLLTFAWTTAFGAFNVVSPTLTLPLGEHVITLEVEDPTGLADNDTVIITVRDTTPPETILTAKPASVSNVSTPSFAFEGTDIVSLPANLLFECKLDSGPWTACSSSQSYSNLADGTHEFQVRAIDEFANVDATPATYIWTLDAAPPTITLNSPAQGASFVLGTAQTAGYSCSDGGSGIDTCTGTLSNGASIQTSNVGSYSFTVNATDLAGNQATVTHNYAVAYNICGAEPFAARRAGSVIPVKLYVCKADGSNLSAQNTVVTATGVVQISNSANAPLEDAGNANPDFNFRFDPSLFGGTGGYIFNLDTNGFTTGTYWLYFKVSGDPSAHRVEFQIR